MPDYFFSVLMMKNPRMRRCICAYVSVCEKERQSLAKLDIGENSPQWTPSVTPPTHRPLGCDEM